MEQSETLRFRKQLDRWRVALDTREHHVSRAPVIDSHTVVLAAERGLSTDQAVAKPRQLLGRF